MDNFREEVYCFFGLDQLTRPFSVNIRLEGRYQFKDVIFDLTIVFLMGLLLPLPTKDNLLFQLCLFLLQKGNILLNLSTLFPLPLGVLLQQL